MEYRFWYTASAVPRYQCSPTRFWGGSISMNSPSSSDTTFQPIRTWRLSDNDLYWVAMKIRRNPGVDAVAECEVDDSVRPAEVNRRFGALLRQRVEPLAGSASEKDNQDIVEVHGVTTGWR